MTAWLSKSKVSDTSDWNEIINRKPIVYCHLEVSVFFVLSKQIPIVCLADRGRAEIKWILKYWSILIRQIKREMKWSSGSTTIKDRSPPLVPKGWVVKRKTTKHGNTSKRSAQWPAPSSPRVEYKKLFWTKLLRWFYYYCISTVSYYRGFGICH